MVKKRRESRKRKERLLMLTGKAYNKMEFLNMSSLQNGVKVNTVENRLVLNSKMLVCNILIK